MSTRTQIPAGATLERFAQSELASLDGTEDDR